MNQIYKLMSHKTKLLKDLKEGSKFALIHVDESSLYWIDLLAILPDGSMSVKGSYFEEIWPVQDVLEYGEVFVLD